MMTFGATQLRQTGKGRSRRQFLVTVGKVAGLSALAGVAVPAVHAGQESPTCLALIGCGGRGTGAVSDAFHTTGGPVKLVALADLFADRVEASFNHLSRAFPQQVDVPAERRFVGFDAYRKAIDSLTPGRDVAILATYAAFRPAHFEYAVQKGVNVFMEKSFAVDSPATRRMLKSAELAEQKNLKIGVGLMWRHSHARQEVIKRIHDGAIGEVHTLRIYRVHNAVHCPQKPPQMTELEFQLRLASRFNWASGGFFVDWHIHNVDVACWAKGAWPVSAQAMGGRCYEEAGNLFDHYTVEYTFTDGTKLFAFARHMNNCWATYSDYAHGTKGSAVIMSNLSDPQPRIYRSQNMIPDEVVWDYGKPDPNPYHAEWQILLDAIRQDKPHNEARRALDANIASLMGRMAAHSGALVTWEEAWNSNFQYVANIDEMTFETPAPIQPDERGIYPIPLPGLTKEH